MREASICQSNHRLLEIASSPQAQLGHPRHDSYGRDWRSRKGDWLVSPTGNILRLGRRSVAPEIDILPGERLGY